MEQRTLLAIILSLIVLFLYNSLFISTSYKPNSSTKTSQEIDNKEVKKISWVAQKTTPDKNFKRVNEKRLLLESPVILAEFSNIGGNLEKVFLKEFNYSPPLTNLVSIPEFDKKEFLVKEQTQKNILLLYEDEKYKIEKRFTLLNNYLISSEIKVSGNLKISEMDNFIIRNYKIEFSRMDNDRYLNGKLNPEDSLLEYSLATIQGVFRKNNAHTYSPKERKEKEESIKWVGFRNRYFCVIVKPEYEMSGYTIGILNEHQLEITSRIKNLAFQNDESQTFESKIFVGPQDLNLLKKYKMQFEEIMDFGWTDAIAKGILRGLNLIHQVIPNWGMCIIILSLVIYGITYPLTLKSMSSMKKMQALQPEIKKIQEQNKNNLDKLNKETMELYKKHRMNPFGGCLPMFLQLPIFMALYQVLWRSFTLKGKGFLWIKDLSEPDRLFILPHSFPVLGNEINILPFFVVTALFFQQRVSMKSATFTNDPHQIAQQKMMTTLFPVMIGFFFYKIASGLSLYFSTFYFLSTFTQWKMSKVKKL